MNIRKQRKKKLAFIVRNYSKWCCKSCYFGLGPGAKYKHDCCESNNDGALKKYWKEYDYLTNTYYSAEDIKRLTQGENNASFTS